MAERPSARVFIDLQKRDLEKAKSFTLGYGKPFAYGTRLGQYPFLSSDLRTYEEELFNGRQLMGYVQEVADSHKDKNEPVRILDYGCGHNVALRELVKQNLSGIKLEAVGISAGDPRTREEKAFDKKNSIQFIDQQDVLLNLPKDRYDIVVSRLAFCHLPNPLETLRTLYKAVRSGGIIRTDFMGLADKFVDETSDYEEAQKKVQQVIADLKQSGIDIEIEVKGEEGEVVVIKKNDVRMRFPNVGLSPNVFNSDTGLGGYIYKK